MRPIYRQGQTDVQRDSQGHAGLWYDRFFDGYPADWQPDRDKASRAEWAKAKSGWINGVAGMVGDRVACEAAALRIANLCSTLHGETRVYTSTWHFATGLGNPHPVENGFLWHPTLGTPYIAGSAVKGLVRAWVEAWMEFEGKVDEEKKNYRLATLYHWFGSEHKDFRERKKLRADGFKPKSKGEAVDTEAGAFIFFDALPVAPVALKADVMTPHMDKWYEQGGNISSVNEPDRVVPADWHDPVPICFLVANKPVFQFAVAARREQHKEEVKHVMEALGQALEWLGAGAKTAVGYGAMSRDEAVEAEIRHKNENRAARIHHAAKAALKEAERRADLARMDPLENQVAELLYTRQDKNQSEISTLIGALKQGRWQGEEKQRVAQLLAARMKAGSAEWKPQSHARKPERDRAYQNTLLVMGWLDGK